MRTKRILAILAVLLVIGASGAFSQAKGILNINCNVSGASVVLDGNVVGITNPNFSGPIGAKSYSLKISKSGYQDFVQTIMVPTTGLTLNVTLLPKGQVATYQLMVTCNVPNATVSVNGNMVGSAPIQTQVAPGSYSVTVRAAGYNDYNQNVVVSGPAQVNAVLMPMQSILSVSANVPNATVSINGNLIGRAPASKQVAPGTYTVTVRAAGYGDYVQTVTVNGPTQVNAIMAPQQASLTINANVQGADVYINGNLSGRTPFMTQVVPGSYSVTVRFAGYNDYSQNVVVNGATQVNATLIASSYPVSVNSGSLNGAQVFLNGNLVGQTPLTTTLSAGSYSLAVRYAGYSDYNLQLVVNGPQTVSAVLSPVAATWQISVPPANLAKDNNGNSPKDAPFGLLQVWIDGARQMGSTGQALAGQHTVRIVSGALQSETIVTFQAGKAYILEPFVGVNVK